MKYLFLIMFSMLWSYGSRAQNIIGEYEDGSSYLESDTLTEGVKCTFRYADNRHASWKIMIDPNGEPLNAVEDSCCIDLHVKSPSNIELWHTWRYSEKFIKGDAKYIIGHVYAEDKAGNRDTVRLVFDVLPRKPKLIRGTVENLDIERGEANGIPYFAAGGDTKIEFDLVNTHDVAFHVYEDYREYRIIFDGQYIFPINDFTGPFTFNLLFLDFAYVVAEPENRFGRGVPSDTIDTMDFIEDEELRESLRNGYRLTSVESNVVKDVKFRRDGQYICVNDEEVNEILLINMHGIVIAKACGNRLQLPVNVAHGCYIVEVRMPDRKITKKWKL